MAKLQLRLPDNVHQAAKRLARQQQISLNQFLVTSVSNELVRQETMAFFVPIAEQFDGKAFREALAKVADVEPVDGDEM